MVHIGRCVHSGSNRDGASILRVELSHLGRVSQLGGKHGSLLSDVDLNGLITPFTASLQLPILKKLLEHDLVIGLCGLSLWLHVVRVLLILMS